MQVLEVPGAQVFVDAAKRYFEKLTCSSAVVRTPFVAEMSQLPAGDFTGIIGIGGAAQGCVYFTAPRSMLHELLLTIGEPDLNDANCADCAGEIANTVAGNARAEFGPGFAISIPVVSKGPLQDVHLPQHVRAVIVPINWRRHACHVVIALNS